MKKYILSALIVGCASMFTSCDDMLDSDPRKTEATPANFSDVEALNAGTYSIMNVLVNVNGATVNFPPYMWEIMSDNCYGSGGLQDTEVKSLHHLVEMGVDQYEPSFITLYGGVSRANVQIETIKNQDWTGNEQKRDQLLGEGYFMRGLYNLWLTQLYGDIPLVTSSNITPEMEMEADAATVVYPQIFADFVSGAALMSDAKYAGSGHANKQVAEAFLARAYMFWAGFYKKAGELANATIEDVTLPVQDGADDNGKAVVLKKQTVIDGLKDIVDCNNYALLDDYRSLWQYSNSLLWDECHDADDEESMKKDVAERGNKAGTHEYKFIADMDRGSCFDQPGMGNGNTEELFQIQFMNASKWAIGDSYYTNSRQYSNYISCFWGLRCNGTNGLRSETYPFNQGWGQGTPSCNIWDDWTKYERTNAEATVAYTDQKGDIRKLGSLIDCVGELDNYTFEKDDCEESGYSVKKFNSVCLDKCKNDLDTWWTCAPGYQGSSLENSMQGDHFEDFYLMRYADVLLMLTELTGDAQYMNLVQKRAGVKQTAYSLEAVQNERRFEFAFEGLRFNDMRRWTGKDVKDGYATKALEAQGGKLITVKGQRNCQPMAHMTCSWKERYEATNGFVSKPQNQINLMNGNLKQNAGWDAADKKTQYKTLY